MITLVTSAGTFKYLSFRELLFSEELHKAIENYDMDHLDFIAADGAVIRLDYMYDLNMVTASVKLGFKEQNDFVDLFTRRRL